MNSNVTIQQLIYVVAVDTHGSFVQAAEECRVSQPALSMQIRKLENTLGVTLFDRSKQPVRATEIGSRIVAQARLVLREADRIQDVVEIANTEMSGEYRLGMLRSIASRAMIEALRGFVSEHPDIRLTVSELSERDILEGLRRDLLDGAIATLPIADAGLESRALYDEPFVACVPPNFPQFEQERIIFRGLDPATLIPVEGAERLLEQVFDVRQGADEHPSEMPLPVRWGGGTVDSVRLLAEGGLGIGLIPRLATDDFGEGPAREMIRELIDPVPFRTVGMILGSGHMKTHVADALTANILAVVPTQLIVHL